MWRVLLAGVMLFAPASAYGQNDPTTIRNWPKHGVWQVGQIKFQHFLRGCDLAAIDKGHRHGIFLMMRIANDKTEFLLKITDSNADNLRNAISVRVDEKKRLFSIPDNADRNVDHGINISLSPQQMTKVTEMLTNGDTLDVGVNTAVYHYDLGRDYREAIRDMNQCMHTVESEPQLWGGTP